MNASEKPRLTPGKKALLDFGPLVVFFASNHFFGIFKATAIFMVVIVATLAVTYYVERKLPVMPVVTAVLVLVFGGLTLWLADERFIKIKPTILYVLFALTLGGGLLAGRPLLKPLLGSALQLTDEGWRIMTLRWALFFVFMAVLNELVWRNFSTDQWVTFKAFGVIALTFVFMLTQGGLLQRHGVAEAEDAAPGAGE